MPCYYCFTTVPTIQTDSPNYSSLIKVKDTVEFSSIASIKSNACTFIVVRACVCNDHVWIMVISISD